MHHGKRPPTSEPPSQYTWPARRGDGSKTQKEKKQKIQKIEKIEKSKHPQKRKCTWTTDTPKAVVTRLGMVQTSGNDIGWGMYPTVRSLSTKRPSAMQATSFFWCVPTPHIHMRMACEGSVFQVDTRFKYPGYNRATLLTRLQSGPLVNRC